MTLPIRAYLLLRDSSGNWSVEICREWESVTECWNKRQHSGAVLHVGFNRPETSAFEAIAAEYPGKVLVSGAAKYAMPPGYESSSQPIGSVEGLPVYLALKGWGYSADDIIAAVQVVEDKVHTQELSDWVKHFAAIRPQVLDDLRASGIHDDQSYLDHESKLPPDVRLRAGQFRCRELLNGRTGDPCALAGSAPPWLQQRKLDTINFSVRVANVFANNGFVTVGDISTTTLEKLLALQNFGRKSANDAMMSLWKALEEGPVEIGYKLEQANAETLLVEIHRALATLQDREADVLIRRMGLGRPAETLQSIADSHNLTRERIRQIESRVVDRLIRECYWDDLLTGKLEALLVRREFPLPLLGIEALDKWFVGVAASSEALRYVLENFCAGRIGVVAIDGIDYFGFLTQERWEAALNDATRTLALGASQQWTEQHCRSVIGPLIDEKAAEFRGLLWDHATKLCHFTEGADGSRTLATFGRGAEQLVEAVLMEAEQPLHYTEIAARAERKGERRLDVRRIHNAAANVGILLARGTYGLAQHINVKPDQADQIREEAERMVAESLMDRQWHASEIHSILLDSGVIDDAVTKYEIDYLLREVPSIKRLGRMAWALNTNGANETERVDIRQSILWLLQEAGRPLSAREIKQGIIAIRGVNATFQIVPGDPLVRVGHGKWGLNDRDLPLKKSDQPALQERIVSHLKAQGRGLHLSELNKIGYSVDNELTPETIVAIAQMDARLRFSYGRYLYLAEWGEPRRESLIEAVKGVMAGASSLPFEAIVTGASSRMQRSAPRTAVSAALQSIGAIYDEAAEIWTAPTGSSTAPDEDETWAETPPQDDQSEDVAAAI